VQLTEEEPDGGPDQDDLVGQFREFIEGVKPEDFSS
jgi:hypothetical protein